jgi:hypothetical protein
VIKFVYQTKDQKPITKLAAKTKNSDQIHRFVQVSGTLLLWLRILTDFSQAVCHAKSRCGDAAVHGIASPSLAMTNQQNGAYGPEEF